MSPDDIRARQARKRLLAARVTPKRILASGRGGGVSLTLQASGAPQRAHKAALAARVASGALPATSFEMTRLANLLAEHRVRDACDGTGCCCR